MTRFAREDSIRVLVYLLHLRILCSSAFFSYCRQDTGLLYTPGLPRESMAKGKLDLILRDRLQFATDASGNRSTVYGRFDLSEYVNTLERKGLSIKEIQFMMRNPSNGVSPITGAFDLLGDVTVSGTISRSNLKIFATTRAYEEAKDVGIASPDVLCIEAWQTYLGPGPDEAIWIEHNKYGTPDLHPDGFPVVTDLLIGVAMDNWTSETTETLELDVMLIAEPITINQKQLTEMLVQGQDQ